MYTPRLVTNNVDHRGMNKYVVTAAFVSDNHMFEEEIWDYDELGARENFKRIYNPFKGWYIVSVEEV